MTEQIIPNKGEQAGNLPSRVATELEKLGIPKNVSGYVYLRKAILLAYEDFSCVHALMTRIYSAIAMEFDSTPKRVERCIRHAIDLAYIPGSEMTRQFATKPTIGLIVADIADRLRLEDGII